VIHLANKSSSSAATRGQYLALSKARLDDLVIFVIDSAVIAERSFVVDAALSTASSSPLCRRNQKLSSSSCHQRTTAAGEAAAAAVSNVAQTKTVSSVKPVPALSNAAEVLAAAVTPDVNEYLNCESARTSTDDVGRKNGGPEAEEPGADGTTGVLVKSVSHLQTDAAAAATSASSVADSSFTAAVPPEESSADKVERLRKLIDRATGQLYTIADVYLMMMKPSRVPLEYDWVTTATDSAAAAAADEASARLRKLVGIAKSAFTVSTAKRRVSLNIDVINVEMKIRKR